MRKLVEALLGISVFIGTIYIFIAIIAVGASRNKPQVSCESSFTGSSDDGSGCNIDTYDNPSKFIEGQGEDEEIHIEIIKSVDDGSHLKSIYIDNKVDIIKAIRYIESYNNPMAVNKDGTCFGYYQFSKTRAGELMSAYPSTFKNHVFKNQHTSVHTQHKLMEKQYDQMAKGGSHSSKYIQVYVRHMLGKFGGDKYLDIMRMNKPKYKDAYWYGAKKIKKEKLLLHLKNNIYNSDWKKNMSEEEIIYAFTKRLNYLLEFGKSKI